MKREILFRGQSTDSKEWIEGEFSNLFSKADICLWTSDDGKSCLRYYPVKEETVGEYIQRTDKHRKKVFEGDVIRVSWTEDGDKIEEYFLIEYVDDDDYFGFVLLDLQKACQPSPNLMFDQKFFTNYCEVVGNKWDNPELLGVCHGK